MGLRRDRRTCLKVVPWRRYSRLKRKWTPGVVIGDSRNSRPQYRVKMKKSHVRILGSQYGGKKEVQGTDEISFRTVYRRYIVCIGPRTTRWW